MNKERQEIGNSSIIEDVCSFLPSYTADEWDLSWVNQVISYLPLSYDLVNQFIRLYQIPRINFVSSKYKESFIIENSLPLWTKAVCVREGVYILFKGDLLNWRRIIDHEFFHAAVFQMYSKSLVVPKWFNEAMAYLVGENINFKSSILKNNLGNNFPKIKELIINDCLLDGPEEMTRGIINSLASFLGICFSRRKIKLFFMCLKKRNEFSNVFNQVFEVSLNDFIDLWHQYICIC